MARGQSVYIQMCFLFLVLLHGVVEDFIINIFAYFNFLGQALFNLFYMFSQFTNLKHILHVSETCKLQIVSDHK